MPATLKALRLRYEKVKSGGSGFDWLDKRKSL